MHILFYEQVVYERGTKRWKSYLSLLAQNYTVSHAGFRFLWDKREQDGF